VKRTHIHVNVEPNEFGPSVDFYATLLGTEPQLRLDHYAKWRLDDPALNFVVEILEVPGETAGVHHVGIEVDDPRDLQTIQSALKKAEAPLLDIGATHCCYAKSEKSWTVDPQGVRWEAFHTSEQTEDYGARSERELAAGFVFGK